MRVKTFKALGIMLWYPNEEWLANGDDICQLIEQEKLVDAEAVAGLRSFMKELNAEELLEIQERYVDTFDRVRSLSLHLFEHVHGESRDRGQAMVDLAERYKEQGLTLSVSELPDYLPVFLEYLSLLPKDTALEELAEIGHILVALGKRLAERGSPYNAVFDCLICLAGREPEKVAVKPVAEEPDFEQLDKEWEEKPINFLGAEAPSGGCGGGSAGGCGGGGCGGAAGKTIEKMTQGAAL